MKELILLRHAKSSWELNVEDRHRTLTKKGMMRISKMALHHSEVFSQAEIIFTSPANRACHTASILVHEVNISFQKLKIVEDLYTFEAAKLIHFIKNISDCYQRVICVGHNPAFTQAITYFSNQDFDHLPTAGCAQLKFEQHQWKAIKAGALTLGIPKQILK